MDIEDDFISYINADGQIDQTLKLPVEDKQTYDEIMAAWKSRGDH